MFCRILPQSTLLIGFADNADAPPAEGRIILIGHAVILRTHIERGRLDSDGITAEGILLFPFGSTGEGTEQIDAALLELLHKC